MNRTARLLLPATLALALACTTAAPRSEPAPPPLDPANLAWSKLETEPYRGKQDDIFFISPNVGWYVNGAGKIFKTTDGGATWVQKLHKPGTYFRCIAFVDERRGFAGNIGPDYFPNVTDATPLYETRDGGETWTPVTAIQGPAPKGLCAIHVVRVPFINAGNLDHKVTIWAGGRVGGPAYLLKSADGGDSWVSVDLSAHGAMILDVEFLDADNGIISSASSTNVAESHARILRTSDGGKTWTKVYESARPYEITWKSSFPTKQVGYVTVQSYDPDQSVTRRVVAKTTDGGRTWSEIPLVDDFAVRELGIAFADESVGWVGTTTGGYETRDGGATWKPVDLGRAANKIRLIRSGNELVGYAIGVNVYKLSAR
jgi:photosystem II stability/assembly factor-like uncharacterized protein